MSQKRAMTQDLPDVDSTAPSPEVVPPVPTNNVEVPPSQPTSNLTTDVLQAFMLTSMENQAQMTQMMQTLVTNQATATGNTTGNNVTDNNVTGSSATYSIAREQRLRDFDCGVSLSERLPEA